MEVRMRRNLIVITSLVATSAFAGPASDHPWLNKSAELQSNSHFQFFSPVLKNTATIRVTDGKVEKQQENSTSETHTVTFQTKPFGKTADGLYWSYYKLRVLDEEWSPETSRTLLEEIAAQIVKGLDLPLEIRRNGKENQHRMVLLLKGEPVITLNLKPLPAKNEYEFVTGFIVPNETGR
jgi:hypothetical protein